MQPRRTRTRRRSVVLAAAALISSGCGGASTPRLAHDDAESLIALTHRIAGERACAQARDIPRLRTRAIALVNAGKVPAALQDTLLSGVNALGEQTPVCLPSVQAAEVPTTTAAPPSPPPAPPAKAKGHGPEKHHGHDHGHGPGKGHGKGH